MPSSAQPVLAPPRAAANAPAAAPLPAPAPGGARPNLRGLPLAAQQAALAPSLPSLDSNFGSGDSGMGVRVFDAAGKRVPAPPRPAAVAPAPPPAAQASGSDALGFASGPLAVGSGAAPSAGPAASAAAAAAQSGGASGALAVGDSGALVVGDDQPTGGPVGARPAAAAAQPEEIDAPAPPPAAPAPPPPTYQVGDTSYTATRTLGQGGFGQVQEIAGPGPDPKKLVVKNARPDQPKGLAALTNEANVHRSVPEHDNVVASRGVQTTPGGQVTEHFMEHAAGGDANHAAARLRQMHAAGLVSHAEFHGALQHITRGTATGLTHLAQQGVSHNDIKADNVLLGGPGNTTPKITDFGLAGDRRNPEPFHMGTINYGAPERGSGGTSPTSDVYSLGQMTHQMTTGRVLPYADVAARHLQRAALAPAPPAPGPGPAAHVGPPRYRTAFDRFIDKTMQFDPARRGDAAGALGEDYLTDPMIGEEAARGVLQRAQRHADGEDVRRRNRPIDWASQAPLDMGAFGSHAMKNAKVLGQIKGRGAAPPAPHAPAPHAPAPPPAAAAPHAPVAAVAPAGKPPAPPPLSATATATPMVKPAPGAAS